MNGDPRKEVVAVGQTYFAIKTRQQELMDNRMLQEACIFNILQIGELSKLGLDTGFTQRYPSLPWNQMYGMRNRLVHDYEGVRLKIVWQTISMDFEPLKNQLSNILDSL